MNPLAVNSKDSLQSWKLKKKSDLSFKLGKGPRFSRWSKCSPSSAFYMRVYREMIDVHCNWLSNLKPKQRRKAQSSSTTANKCFLQETSLHIRMSSKMPELFVFKKVKWVYRSNIRITVGIFGHIRVWFMLKKWHCFKVFLDSLVMSIDLKTSGIYFIVKIILFERTTLTHGLMSLCHISKHLKQYDSFHTAIMNIQFT